MTRHDRDVPVQRATATLVGHQQIDEFHAICHLLGLRPHELATKWAVEGIRRARYNDAASAAVDAAVLAAREQQGRDPTTGRPVKKPPTNVVPMLRRKDRR
jgi:hypothetical protein